MTATDYRIQLRDIKSRMCRDESIDSETYSAASDWVASELAQMEREANEKDRPARRPSLRNRLRHLVTSILAHSAVGVKEAAQDV